MTPTDVQTPPIVIFDLDGTLVDTRADLTTAVNLMRADYDLPPLSLATVVSFVGDGMRNLVERALRDASHPPLLDTAISSMRSHYAEHLLDKTCLYPGVSDTLIAVRRLGYRLAVVSNKPVEFTKQICQDLHLASSFEVILGGDSCAKRKPDPAPLLNALEMAACAKQGSWMVGDNYTDVEAGIAAGLRICFCTYGFGKSTGGHVDLSVNKLAEFAEFLQSEADSRPF